MHGVKAAPCPAPAHNTRLCLMSLLAALDGRVCAVKLLRPEHAQDRSLVKMLMKEASICISLDHRYGKRGRRGVVGRVLKTRRKRARAACHARWTADSTPGGLLR